MFHRNVGLPSRPYNQKLALNLFRTDRQTVKPAETIKGHHHVRGRSDAELDASSTTVQLMTRFHSRLHRHVQTLTMYIRQPGLQVPSTEDGGTVAVLTKILPTRPYTPSWCNTQGNA
jgi:hypothetical protein